MMMGKEKGMRVAFSLSLLSSSKGALSQDQPTEPPYQER